MTCSVIEPPNDGGCTSSGSGYSKEGEFEGCHVSLDPIQQGPSLAIGLRRRTGGGRRTERLSILPAGSSLCPKPSNRGRERNAEQSRDKQPQSRPELSNDFGIVLQLA